MAVMNSSSFVVPALGIVRVGYGTSIDLKLRIEIPSPITIYFQQCSDRQFRPIILWRTAQPTFTSVRMGSVGLGRICGRPAISDRD